MATKSLMRSGTMMPSLFDDFFRPWNEWLDKENRWHGTLTVPAANVTESAEEYLVSLAAPGMERGDFNIDVNGNVLTISCEKEDEKEEKDKSYTRKEFNYTSFSRSFTIPEEVNKDKIEAKYEDGVLKLNLPKKEEVKKAKVSKHITVK